jgi:hypothetical protein
MTMKRLSLVASLFSLVMLSLPVRADDPYDDSTDPDDDPVMASWIDTGDTMQKAVVSDTRDRDHATYAGWTRDLVFTAWRPKNATVHAHSDYHTRVVFNVDAGGHVRSPVIVSTNASSDFHESIQKALSKAALNPPPPGEGNGIVIDFYADPAYR